MMAQDIPRPQFTGKVTRAFAPTPDQSAFKAGFGKRGKQKAKCPSPPSKSPLQTRLFITDADVSPRAVGFEKSTDSSSGSIIIKNWEEEGQDALELFEKKFAPRIKIGSGDFADVFKCQDINTGAWYAIKRTRKTFRGALDRQCALGEAEALAQVGEHRNIVNFYRVWEERGRTCIQMELYEKTLKQSLDEIDHRGERVPEPQIWESIMDLSLGLYHIHQQGFLHLDLKPENIFISKEGNLVIGDFGNAVRNGKWTGDSDGTNKYMALETLNGPVSFPADICSLGLVILEMALLKDLPSGGELWHALRENTEAHFPSQLYSPELRGLVSAMTDRHPLRRPSAREILRHPLIAELLDQKHIDVESAGKPPSVLNSPFKRSRSLEDIPSSTPFFDPSSLMELTNDFQEPNSPLDVVFGDISPIALDLKKRSEHSTKTAMKTGPMSPSKRYRLPTPEVYPVAYKLKRHDSRDFLPRSHPGKLQGQAKLFERDEHGHPPRRNLLKEFLKD